MSINVDAARIIDILLKDVSFRIPVLLKDKTPDVLVKCGVKDLPIYENPSHIRKNILTESEAKELGLRINKRDNYHGLGKDLFLKAIDSLDDPRVIFVNKKHPNNYLIITTIKDSANNNIVVPIEIESTTSVNRIDINTNRIKSVYSFDNHNHNLNEYIKYNIKNNIFKKVYEKKDEVWAIAP